MQTLNNTLILCGHFFEQFSFQGLNAAELNGENFEDVSIEDVRKMLNHWYETKSTYQFPGGNQPFESCSNASTSNDYGLFTQVILFIVKI